MRGFLELIVEVDSLEEESPLENDQRDTTNSFSQLAKLEIDV